MDYDDDTNTISSSDVGQLMVYALKQRRFVGQENDFHNTAVDLARKGYYPYACRLLEKGLRIFLYSIDLLSDYVLYCVEGDRKKKGE